MHLPRRVEVDNERTALLLCRQLACANPAPHRSLYDSQFLPLAGAASEAKSDTKSDTNSDEAKSDTKASATDGASATDQSQVKQDATAEATARRARRFASFR